MFTISLGLVWLALLMVRGTPIGRAMQHVLVAVPASRLTRPRRRTVIAVGLLAMVLLASVWLLGHEGMVITGMALPEFGTLFASVEVSAWVDAVIAVSAAASLLKVRNSIHWLRVRLGRPRRRATRARRTQRPKRPANDDEPGALRLAA